MTLARALQVAAGNSQETGDVAEAIDFDGTNDYLSRASDLVGNSIGKTFTFSFWVCNFSGGTGRVYRADGNGSSSFDIYITNSTLVGNLTNTVGSNTLSFTLPWGGTTIINNTWYNIIVSIDLASSANRYVYVNDINVTSSVTWTTYANTVSAFSQPNHFVAAGSGGGSKLTGRLSNVFLDRTYRDLTVTANRRLFVTADLKPAADQAALNPILYLPMNDPTAPGVNAGTGGDFTLTGTVARSGRGPNQYNAPYSDLDGSADYLSRTTAPTGIADGKAFTISYAIRPDTTGENYVFSIASSTTNRFYVAGNGGKIQVAAWNSAGTIILLAETTQVQYVVGRNSSVVISIDLSSTANRAITVNGSAVTVTWATYTNDTIDFNVATSPVYRVGCNSSTTFFNGKLGALWFNTSYIDLSVADNLAKFVTGTGIDAKPVDLGASGELPTGTSPLIYLPMYGNNAGKNYGTGGDFTVNSGPYTGARGPNEFWGNKADFNGSTGYLSRTSALAGIADSKTFSVTFWIQPDTSSATVYVMYGEVGSSNIRRLAISRSSTNNISISARNSAGTQILAAITTTNNITAGGTYCVQVCIDLADTAKRFIYVNGTAATVNWIDYTNDTIDFDGADSWEIGSGEDYNYKFDGDISELYLATSYIDFSQESNRLKFRDAFGNPVNLTQQIEDGAIPNPAIYMRFPPTAFGTNSGTGGNFTVNGTITDGGQL